MWNFYESISFSPHFGIRYAAAAFTPTAVPYGCPIFSLHTHKHTHTLAHTHTTNHQTYMDTLPIRFHGLWYVLGRSMYCTYFVWACMRVENSKSNVVANKWNKACRVHKLFLFGCILSSFNSVWLMEQPSIGRKSKWKIHVMRTNNLQQQEQQQRQPFWRRDNDDDHDDGVDDE